MAQLTVPIDAARFAKGLSWKDYMAQMGDTQARTEDNYGKTKLTDEERKFFSGSALGKVKYALMLAENWCGDVHRNSPLLAHICEAMPNCELRVFFRDQNLDIMNEFLYKGEFQSIPTLVFYDNDLNVLGVFHERAQKARDEIPVHMSPISAKMRDETLSEDERKKYMDEYTAFQSGPMWASWRDAEITECREILEKAAAQK